MNSRFEKYNEFNENERIQSRLNRNKRIYEEIHDSEFSSVSTNSNVRVIEDSPKVIDVEKIKKYIEAQNRYPERKKVSIIPEENSYTEDTDEKSEGKIYDINSVLEKARQGREQDYEQNKYRKLRDTQFDILSKIKVYDEEEKSNLEEEFNTDERTLIDLINTVTIQKEHESLLSELESGNENTIVTNPIEEENNNIIKEEIDKELNKFEKNPEIEDKIKDTQKIDNSFYTNSLSFSKDDFEVFEELEKTVKKNNVLVKFGIFVLIILGLTTIYVILKFIFNFDLLELL